ncbi:MAG: hypothetical protein AAGJ82_01615 [Bacteroidota bacterium]
MAEEQLTWEDSNRPLETKYEREIAKQRSSIERLRRTPRESFLKSQPPSAQAPPPEPTPVKQAPVEKAPITLTKARRIQEEVEMQKSQYEERRLREILKDNNLELGKI